MPPHPALPICGLLLLGLFAPMTVMQAAPPPAVSPSPAPLWLGNPGIDQAKARAHRRDQTAAWLRSELATTLGDYDRIGQKDPRWDEDARAALENLGHALAKETDAAARTEAAKPLLRHALAAGCTDPLVAYFGIRTAAYPPAKDTAAMAQQFAKAEADLEGSRYSTLRKFYASNRAADLASQAVRPDKKGGLAPPPPPGTDAAASMDRARGHLVELLRDPAAQRDSVYTAAADFLHNAESFAGGKEHVFEPLAKAFAAGEWKQGDKATAALVEGEFWTSYAWQARTSGWAQDVTEEGWRLFGERLPRAAAALTRGYALDPAEPNIPREMMTVELGQGEGRARLETWFRRGMDADPDGYDVCTRKLGYLEPKWYGDAPAMLAFGHECLASANWKARLPFILLQAHTILAKTETTPEEYWKRPEVWTDVQALYKAALAADPGSLYDRSGYALYAYRAEQWKLADELFTALGDKPNLRAMQCTAGQYQHMREIAADNATGQ